MDQSAFHSDFELEDAQIRSFREKGFAKLEKFFSSDIIHYLRARADHELNEASPNVQNAFNRLKYDFTSKNDDIYELINQSIISKNSFKHNRKNHFFHIRDLLRIEEE